MVKYGFDFIRKTLIGDIRDKYTAIGVKDAKRFVEKCEWNGYVITEVRKFDRLSDISVVVYDGTQGSVLEALEG